MRLFAKVDGSVDRLDRPFYFGGPFDLAYGAAVVTLPATLLAAIRVYWDGGSGLAAAVGPLYAGKARPGLSSTSPWVRVQQESVTNRFDVLRGHYELRTVTFLVRAPTVAAADLGAEALIAGLDAAPVASLAFAGASLVGFRRTGGAMAAEVDLGPGGKPVHGARIGYRALVVRP